MGKCCMTYAVQMPPGFTLEIQNSDYALVEVKNSERTVFSRRLPLGNQAVYAAVVDATAVSWTEYMQAFEAGWEALAQGSLIADDHEA
jgi:hypothetical protein